MHECSVINSGLDIRRIRTLRGPNIWSRRPVLEAWVDLGSLKDTPSDSVPGFTDRLMAWLPSLIEHRCSIGERGGFLQRLRTGTYPAHILEHITLELQSLAGTPVGFGKARETSEEGVYRVVVRYREEQVARAALYAARELVLAAMQDRPFDVQAEVARLRDVVESVCLGPSTSAIVAAAEARGIPTRRLNAGSLVQLGQGVKQHRIWTAETDGTSAIAESIAQDKELTKQLLRAAGVPVPEGQVVPDAAEAWATAEEIGVPVVVKPRDANHGRGVFINLFTQDQVQTAFEKARPEGSGVIVERFAPGSEHRLLVVGDKLVAAARGDAAFVTGNGRSTVRQLVEDQLNSDPRRGESHSSPLAKIEFDAPTVLLLTHQGCEPDSVPPEGATVLIQRNGNRRIDVTDEVHPTTAAHVVLAARMVGLDIAGVDVVAQDISRPLEEQGGVIVEVNASPGLHAHLMPGVGKPRPVGEAIIAKLFPEGENGRIPITCVTGTNGKTTVTRLVTHLLRASGRRVGMSCSDGIWVGERIIERGDCGGPRSARKVLLHPEVEAAVFEAGRGGILREGL
ncbi:MAG: cyanophycin synthetase, partial [Archangium sp.]